MSHIFVCGSHLLYTPLEHVLREGGGGCMRAFSASRENGSWQPYGEKIHVVGHPPSTTCILHAAAGDSPNNLIKRSSGSAGGNLRTWLSNGFQMMEILSDEGAFGIVP
jgi:hypothetical protein